MAVTGINWQAPFGAYEGRLYKITATGDQLSGGSTDPTYANGLLIACLETLTWGRELINAELEGNDTVCDVYVKTKKATFELGMGGLDIEQWEILMGATAQDFGGGDDTYIDITENDVPAEFGLIVAARNSQGGDTHFVIMRAKAVDGPGGELAQGAHYEESWGGDGLRSYYGDGVFVRVIHHEAATAVPAVWPGNAAY